MAISCRVLLSMRNVTDESCRGYQNTHFMFNNFLPKIVSFMKEKCEKNLTKPDKPHENLTRRMRIACCITKATDTPQIQNK